MSAEAPSRRGVFDLIYRTNLVYNQCWEDPALDQEALALGPGDRVLAITSAGCNVLDYALRGARVLAVDANPRQNHLLELKLAGIRGLGFADFYALFGDGGSPRVGELYGQVRHLLGPDARLFWDRSIRMFDPRRSPGSFYYGGTAGFFALMFRRYVDHVAKLRSLIERMMAASVIEEQLELYFHGLRPRLLTGRFLRMVGTRGVLALLGVPAAQRELVAGRPGGVVAYLRACLDHVAAVALLRENYFWSVYIRGSYTRDACPEYLKAAAFAQLQAGLVDNIRVATATVTACLERETEPFTAFVLLDHMDWMARRPSLLEEEWRRIFALSAPGARVIFRSGAREASFLPAAVRERLAFDPERAERLHRRDRVGTYGSFHIARVLA
jgi:S-adenosylmethionine-diacylglycerol 3-amino-3-carboxypropyl transferase